MPEDRPLADDLVLVGLDPRSGKVGLGNHARLLVEGAVVLDLLRAGRVAVSGEGLEARVRAVDSRHPAHPAHPAQQRGLTRLSSLTGAPTAADLAALEASAWWKRRVVRWATARQGPGLRVGEAFPGLDVRGLVVEHLAATGVLVPRDGVLRRGRHDVGPEARREELEAALRAVALGEREADERTGPLLALLGVAGVLASVLNGAAHLARWAPRERREEMAGRARALADRDWRPDGVRTVLQALGATIAERDRKRARSS